ncbi:GTP-binding protein [Actinomyces slackii]|uniref:Putative GTP-binding protein YjiA n=1 Tax=Actinomyces slackii TaxID=52774 RepID=A0A448K9P9_9ACTO|nr:GTP-binding protein [Actinomyces slackii]VEG73607.1 putative GTP-binding protein YjiA [Actinomyces slackii]
MTTLIPLSGFLGAGKTTLMLAAARHLESQGSRVSVITNDQGEELVDTHLAQQVDGIQSVSEITGGCFCCRFDDLVNTLMTVIENKHPDIILAEAVGSCTDLQSTVVRPLRQLHSAQLSIAPLTAVVDPVRYRALWRSEDERDAESDLAYLFRHQLDDADIIVINKTDLVADQGTTLTSELQKNFPHAQVVATSAATGQGVESLVALWSAFRPQEEHRSFEIDYDRYGGAEAELAWANQTFTTDAKNSDSFQPAQWAHTFLTALGEETRAQDAVVGHVKLRSQNREGAVKASLTADELVTFDEKHTLPSTSASWTLNARVAVPPAEMDKAISIAVLHADRRHGTLTGQPTGATFQPSYPTPTYRL